MRPFDRILGNSNPKVVGSPDHQLRARMVRPSCQ
ncbi:MAG: hypothetical protein QOK29_4833 [Rhodospirillaceae bacterium]|nr:hypothetical protein [Rhodospirillaceae bacterium]